MYKNNDEYLVSASDLVGHLYCRHLTTLELDIAAGRIKEPHFSLSLLDTLRKRGAEHESNYVEHLKGLDRKVITIPSVGRINTHQIEMSLDAMKTGVDVIVQATFKNEPWVGRADVLLKTGRPSSLGNWSFEAVDTKLSRETKGGTILQLCRRSLSLPAQPTT